MTRPVRHGAQAALGRLRQDIARLEGRFDAEKRLELDPVGEAALPADPHARPVAGLNRMARLQPLGAPRLDAMLGGGLALGDLHEVRAAESRDGACAAGFLVGSLAALMARPGTGDRTIVWIGTADKSREAGEIYPPGLAALGLDPKRIIRIAAPRTADALWTFEAALACRGVVFAVCEVRGQTGYQTGYQTSHRAGHRARGLDLTATRRLALRAQASGATGFLLRFAETPEPTAAATRLLIAPAPSSVDPAHAGGFGPNPGRNLGRNLGGNWGGRPAWRVSLEKARFGRPGTIDLEWNAAGQCFAERKGEHEQADDRDDSAGRRAADGIAGDGGAGTRPRPDADHVRMAAEPSDRPADPDRQSAA